MPGHLTRAAIISSTVLREKHLLMMFNLQVQSQENQSEKLGVARIQAETQRKQGNIPLKLKTKLSDMVCATFLD